MIPRIPRCFSVLKLLVAIFVVVMVLSLSRTYLSLLQRRLPVHYFSAVPSSASKTRKDHPKETVVTTEEQEGERRKEGDEGRQKGKGKEDGKKDEADPKEAVLNREGQKGEGGKEGEGRQKEEGGGKKAEDLCEQKGRGDVIHVVTAGDRHTFAAIVTLATSVVMNTHSPVMFHFITFDTQVANLSSILQSSRVKDTPYQIIPFSGDTLKGQFIVRGPRQDLANPMNFVRFYLPDLLPCVDQVAYLDADCLVLGDVKNLYNWPIKDNHVAALLPEKNKYATMVLNFNNHYVQKLGIKKNTQIMSAGVFVANLTRWRARNITGQLDYWMKLNVRSNVVRYTGQGPGSQAIFLLVLYDKYTPLDVSWNRLYEYQQKHEQGTRTNLLHWNGPGKPWINRNVKNFDIWLHYSVQSNTTKLFFGV